MRSTKRFLVMLSLLVLAVSVTAQPAAAKSAKLMRNQAVEAKIDYFAELERKSKTVVNFWQNKGRWHTRPGYKLCKQVPGKRIQQDGCFRARQSLRSHLRRIDWANKQQARLRLALLYVGNTKHWRCIQRHERNPEQGWATKTGNGYYGGLQMDWDFMSTYGPPVLGYDTAEEMFARRGTADQWHPLEQMAVAQYAKDSGRGYYPWPNTARFCNLI